MTNVPVFRCPPCPMYLVRMKNEEQEMGNEILVLRVGAKGSLSECVSM